MSRHVKLVSMVIFVSISLIALAVFVSAFAVPSAKSFGGVIKPVQFSYSRSFTGKAIERGPNYGTEFVDVAKQAEERANTCREFEGGKYPISIADVGIKLRLEKAGYTCVAKDDASWCCKKPIAWQQI